MFTPNKLEDDLVHDMKPSRCSWLTILERRSRERERERGRSIQMEEWRRYPTIYRFECEARGCAVGCAATHMGVLPYTHKYGRTHLFWCV